VCPFLLLRSHFHLRPIRLRAVVPAATFTACLRLPLPVAFAVAGSGLRAIVRFTVYVLVLHTTPFILFICHHYIYNNLPCSHVPFRTYLFRSFSLLPLICLPFIHHFLLLVPLFSYSLDMPAISGSFVHSTVGRADALLLVCLTFTIAIHFAFPSFYTAYFMLWLPKLHTFCHCVRRSNICVLDLPLPARCGFLMPFAFWRAPSAQFFPFGRTSYWKSSDPVLYLTIYSGGGLCKFTIHCSFLCNLTLILLPTCCLKGLQKL